MEFFVTLIALAALVFFVIRSIRKNSEGQGGGPGIRIERDNNDQV